MPKFFVSQNYGDGKSSDEMMIESASMRSAAREIYQRDYDLPNAAPVVVLLNVRPDRQTVPRSQCRVERLPDGSIGISQMINREPATFFHTYGVSIWDEHNPVDVVAIDEREAAKEFVNDCKPPLHMKEPLMLSVKVEHAMRCSKVMAWLTVDGLQAEVISEKRQPRLSEADLLPVEEGQYEEYDAEKWGTNIHDSEPDSASEAIDCVMKPMPPFVNEVSEPVTMTISPPHPWMIFRVYSGQGNEPMLVLAMSMEEALKKAERGGYTVKSIHHVLFVDGVETLEEL